MSVLDPIVGMGGGDCSSENHSYGGGCTVVGGKPMYHSNRKIHKKRNKTLRKYLVNKKRRLFKTLKRSFKHTGLKGKRKRLKKRKLSMKRKLSNKRKLSKKRKSTTYKRRRMSGGSVLSPAIFSPSGETATNNNIMDSAQYSIGSNLHGNSAMANPPPVIATNGCSNV